MYMVANAVYPNVRAICIVDELPNIGMHPIEIGIEDIWTCCLDVEDNVQIYFAKWLWHIFLLLPFQGEGWLFIFLSPGCRYALPWAMKTIGLSARPCTCGCWFKPCTWWLALSLHMWLLIQTMHVMVGFVLAHVVVNSNHACDGWSNTNEWL